MLKETKRLLKSTFPNAAELFAKTKEEILSAYSGDGHVSSVFSAIYKRNLWANGESRSGRCSTIEATATVRQQLPGLLKNLNVRSLLDAPCGDFNWMRQTELDLDQYIGADIVPELIASNRHLYSTRGRTFEVMDITKDAIPCVDLILCRDCLIHLSSKLIAATFNNFKRSGSKYLLTTTYTLTRDNKDILTGDVRFINLQLAPYFLPAPLDLIVEEPEHGKSLALWRGEDL